jgi:hypothetical protein
MIEGSCRSTLIFVAFQEPTQSTYFNQLSRVREPVSRAKSGVHGKVADVFSGRSRHAESQNELRAFRVLLATAHPDAWQEQPLVLEYGRQGKNCRYTPDILVIWGTHREVVEIKEDDEAELPENRERFTLIRELLGEHGYHFRLWKKSEICAQPRLTNVELVLRYRSVEVSAAERESIRLAFSTTPEARLHTFRETPGISLQSVLRLVLEGSLHVDWWERLTLSSRVSITPIGRQVWPLPPPISSRSCSMEVACR